MTILNDHLETLKKGYPSGTYTSDRPQQEAFNKAVSQIRRALLDAEVARIDSDGYREVVMSQSRRIAELEAENTRLTTAAQIVPAPAPAVTEEP